MVPGAPDELQPVNTEFALGVAVSVTLEFWANNWSHVPAVPGVQPGTARFIAPLSLVTTPAPVPDAGVSFTFFAISKPAVTVRDMSMVTVHGVSPGHAKPGSELVHPVKTKLPVFGVAVSVTVGTENAADWLVHESGQLMPFGTCTSLDATP